MVFSPGDPYSTTALYWYDTLSQFTFTCCVKPQVISAQTGAINMLRLGRYIHASPHTHVSVSAVIACPRLPASIPRIMLFFQRASAPHNSVSLFPRQLLREQLSGTDCRVKVSAPPDRASDQRFTAPHTRPFFSSQVGWIYAALQRRRNPRVPLPGRLKGVAVADCLGLTAIYGCSAAHEWLICNCCSCSELV